MDGRLTLLLRMRLWSVLLLAAIGLQAAEPIRAPLERTTGSAWSSATRDLALAANRKSEDAGQEATPRPPLPLHPRRGGHVAIETPQLTVLERPLPWAQAPPAYRHPAAPPDSTAPPLS